MTARILLALCLAGAYVRAFLSEGRAYFLIVLALAAVAIVILSRLGFGT